MIIITIICVAFAHFFVIYPLYQLYRNYLSARKTGLRIIISPLTPYTLQWQLATSFFRPFLQQYRWFRAIDWTCCWQDNDKLHQELGLCFAVVAPGHNVLCTSDSKTIEYVLRKWRDFVKPDFVNEILGTFGQNVDTSNGDDWIRHRKITAPCFNERASVTVWNEVVQQSQTMAEQWLSSVNGRTNSITTDTSSLALNVISSVAFENTEVHKPTQGHVLSLRDALVTVMSTSISSAVEGIMPVLKLPVLRSLLPANMKSLLLAMQEFRQYTDETVIRERKKVDSGEARAGSLISTLIKANQGSKAESGVSKARLSDSELRGNIFIFTIGGLESTSITLSYALALLAAYPDIQNWVVEELDEVLHDERNGDMGYTRVFPQLKRVIAIMYETLRLYSPSPPLPRSPFPTDSYPTIPQTGLESENSTVHIRLPAKTQIMLNAWASHTSAANFSDPLTWNPKRWIASYPLYSTNTSLPDVLTTEEVKHPTSGSGFFAWGSGPRICPGMKFSQVEFCGALSTILKKVRVDVVYEEGGQVQVARQKMMGILRDSCADPLLLHVRRPEKLELKIIGR